MSERTAQRALDTVVEQIVKVDEECSTLLNGVEHGLINVKYEFRDKAIEAVKKKLTEETLIAWRICHHMRALGWHVDWEVSYPDSPSSSGQKCDLVIGMNDKQRLWLELKLASKAWFNCEGDPTYRNGLYLSYLQGKNRSHSFYHDLMKLTQSDVCWSEGDHQAVCLVGFDWIQKPMDDEVAAVVDAAVKDGRLWKMVCEKHWIDRRSPEFRVNAWCWLLSKESPPLAAHTSSSLDGEWDVLAGQRFQRRLWHNMLAGR